MHGNNREPILKNARRLRNDAKVLADAERYASCGLLQIFCLEELGKYHLAGRGITNAKKNWHSIKQETALSLAGGRAFERLMEEKCLKMGWDYWGKDEDADAWDNWLLTEGKDELNLALGKVSSWYGIANQGFLETVRRILAYVDLGDDATGKTMILGESFSYQSADLNFVTTAFSFIDDAFECLGSESAMGTADLLRTQIWRK